MVGSCHVVLVGRLSVRLDPFFRLSGTSRLRESAYVVELSRRCFRFLGVFFFFFFFVFRPLLLLCLSVCGRLFFDLPGAYFSNFSFCFSASLLPRPQRLRFVCCRFSGQPTCAPVYLCAWFSCALSADWNSRQAAVSRDFARCPRLNFAVMDDIMCACVHSAHCVWLSCARTVPVPHCVTQ